MQKNSYVVIEETPAYPVSIIMLEALKFLRNFCKNPWKFPEILQWKINFPEILQQNIKQLVPTFATRDYHGFF